MGQAMMLQKSGRKDWRVWRTPCALAQGAENDDGDKSTAKLRIRLKQKKAACKNS